MGLKRAVAAGIVLAATLAPAAAQAAPELSITDRLQDRRYGAAGERARIIGFQDGRFYANGWHIAGEMGGIWSEPIKLVDGVWFGIDDQWVGQATEFTSGWGYVKFDLPTTGGLQLERTDFAPDGRRGALIGLEAHEPERVRPHRHGQGRRPLRAPGRVSVELRQHAARERPAARHGRRRGRRAALPRAGHAAAPERDAARLRGLRGVRPPARRSRGQHRRQRPPRPAGHERVHRRGAAQPVRRRPVRQGRGRPAALPGHRRRPRQRDAVDRGHGLRQGPAGRALRAARRPAPSGPPAQGQDRGARALGRPHAALAAGRPAPPGGRRLGQAERARPHARTPRTCRSAGSTRATSTRRRSAPWTAPAGSAPATRTTRGCSPPTASTRRSRASPWASSRRSRTT